MKKRILFFILIVIIIGVFLFFINSKKVEAPELQEPSKEALMLLIEFEDTLGVNNFVYELNKRDIPSLLLVHPDFIEENKEDILKLQDYNVEIALVLSDEPLWDKSYKEQYQKIKEAKDKIESIIKKPIRVIGSKYFAYDENTLKVAQDLGIEYVLSRGVTGGKATIFKPQEYDVLIFSVSNINSEKWGRGSLCDYSYWAREGDPEDFKIALFENYERYDKISPVSHTYIGGLKQRWNEAYLNFFDNTDIDWKNLDQFGKIDIELPFAEIPQNREVQYETPKPAVSLEKEENVFNPCLVDGTKIKLDSVLEEPVSEVIMWGNAQGQMCIDFFNFFEENNIEYEKHLTSEDDFIEELSSYVDYYNSSEGISNNFEYYPIIFIKGRMFSGFDSEIAQEILDILEKKSN